MNHSQQSNRASSTSNLPPGSYNLEANVHKHTGVRLSFFTHGNFADAQRYAQTEAKFIFLYLHSPSHPNTIPFLKRILTCDALVLLLREHFVLYGASVQEAEGYKLSQQYTATTFPFVAVGIKKVTVMKIQGDFGRDEFLQHLRTSMDNGEPVRSQEVTWVADRKSREMAREMHEKELADAQRIDAERLAQKRADEEEAAAAVQREKELEVQAKREAEEKLAAEHQAKRQIEESARQQLAKLEKMRQEAKAKLIAEDSPKIAEAEAGDLATIRVVSLDGTPHERKFSLLTSTSQLYYFARLQEEYDGRPFQCMCGFPPQSIPSSDEALIKDFKVLYPRAVVNLREIY